MTLQDVFDWLRYGELAQSSFYDSDTNELLEKNRPKIISHVVLGLTDLHTKFALLERTVTIQEEDYITFYYLKSIYAQTNPDPTPEGNPKYIMDTVEAPFTDDVIRVEQVYNEIGEELPLNQPSDEASLFTPKYNVIQIPQAVSTNSIFVSYRANHPLIPLDTEDLSTVTIDIPDTHFQALLFFVAWRTFASIAGQDSSPVSAENHMKYMNEVSQIMEKNLNQDFTISQNIKFTKGGWV